MIEEVVPTPVPTPVPRGEVLEAAEEVVAGPVTVGAVTLGIVTTGEVGAEEAMVLLLPQ